MQTDVLIIGAGPTGLMAANQLQRFGINFKIIDLKSGPTIESRAIAVTARSLEIYQQMGLSDTVLTDGQKINELNIYSGGKRKAHVEINEIGAGLSDFTYLIAFEQSKNEKLLAQNLQKNGAEVGWNTELVSFKTFHHHVEAAVKKNGEESIISAKFMIACDGARSLVRHQLKFSFKGGTYENIFFVADTGLKWDLPYDQLIISPAYTNSCAFFPLKGENKYRIIGTLPREYHKNDNIGFEEIEKEVIKTLGVDLKFENVNWFAVYNLHHRCVNTFRNGLVFLAGDSAHIHSPAGGQGMNTGLQDAYNIAWKIAFYLKGYANNDLLQTYNEERLPFAQWLMKFTDTTFSMMTSDNWFIARFRKFIAMNMVGKVLSVKILKPIIFRTVSQLWYSYSGMTLAHQKTKQKLKFRSGDLLPYAYPEIYLKFTDACFHILHISNQPLSEERKKAIANTFHFPVKFVEDQPEKWSKFRVSDELFLVIRPDNYIAMISDELNQKEIINYIKKFKD